MVSSLELPFLFREGNGLSKFRFGLFQCVLKCSGAVDFAPQMVKVKVTLVQALRLCTGRTAHRGSRGIALPFHDHGTRRG